MAARQRDVEYRLRRRERRLHRHVGGVAVGDLAGLAFVLTTTSRLDFAQAEEYGYPLPWVGSSLHHNSNSNP